MTPVHDSADRESALLVAAARAVVHRRDARPAVAHAVDWTRVIRLATRHDLLGILSASAARTSPVWPETIEREVANASRAIAGINLLSALQLRDVLGLLEGQGIPVLFWKGIALAQQLYPDPHLRPVRDLDILVRKSDVRRAADALAAQGYSRRHRMAAAAERWHLDSASEWELAPPHRRLRMELQWAFAPPSLLALDYDRVWRRARRITHPLGDIPVPGREDLLLALCVHGAKHVWWRLKWLVDVAALLERYPDLDWDLIVDTARAARAHKRLLLGLRLAHDLFAARLPPHVRASAQRDPDVGALAARVRHDMFAESPAPPGIVRTGVTTAAACDSTRDKTRFWMRFVMVPTAGDYGAVALPSAFTFGYYAVRPLRLVGKYGRERSATFGSHVRGFFSDARNSVGVSTRSP